MLRAWSVIPVARAGKASLGIGEIAKRVSGKRVSHVAVPETGRVAIHFVDGSALVVERRRRGLAVDFAAGEPRTDCPAVRRPTPRQREYLDFIEKYTVRFGVAPAEADIQRHVLVSAPSVNQMVQRLERLGFITRRRGVARSIRVVGATDCPSCGGVHLQRPRVD